MTLLAFAAERRAVEHPAAAVVDRYLLLAGPTAANPLQRRATMGKTDRQTNGRTTYRYIDPAAYYVSSVIKCIVVIANSRTNIHCVSKKQDTKLLPITSPNVNRFSKFFHWQTQW